MVQIAMLTASNDDHANIVRNTIHSKIEYCLKNHYTFICDSIPTTFEKPAYWYKLVMLQTYLRMFDWCFWLDTDAYVKNMDFKLEELTIPGYEMVIGYEEQNIVETGGSGPNTGSFLMHNSTWSYAFLLLWYNRDVGDHGWFENKSFLELNDPNYPILYVPQKKLNSYPTNYKKGDFILHFPGGWKELLK